MSLLNKLGAIDGAVNIGAGIGAELVGLAPEVPVVVPIIGAAVALTGIAELAVAQSDMVRETENNAYQAEVAKLMAQHRADTFGDDASAKSKP